MLARLLNVILIAASFHAAAASADTLGSRLTGIIKQSLPRPPDAEPQGAEYFKPGTWTLSGSPACGDSDVANFAAAHPNVLFAPVNTATVPVVVGYWEVPAGATGAGKVPDGANFVAIGVGSLPVGGSLAKLTPVNDAKNPQPVLQSALSGISEAMRVQGFEMRAGAAAPAKADLWAGAMACANPGTPSGSGLSVAQLAFSIEGAMSAEIRTAADSAVAATGADPMVQLSKFDLNADASGMHVSFNPTGKYSSAHPYFSKAGDTLALTFPSTAKSPSEYTDMLTQQNPALASYLQTVASDLATKTSYDQVTGLSAPTGGRFFWELGFPMQTQAQAADPLADLVQQLYTQGGSFDNLRKTIARTLFATAITERALFAINTDFASIKPSINCFQSNPYIYGMYGSLVFNLDPSAASLQKSVVTVHPEGNTAFGGLVPYEDAATGNVHAIFEMGSTNNGTPITRTRNLAGTVPTELKRSSDRFEFQIREIGCSGGRPYCRRDVKKSMELF